MSDLPANIELEQQVIGCILTRSQYLDSLPLEFKQEHFYEPLHQDIFRHMLVLKGRGEEITIPSLVKYFEDHPALNDIDVTAGFYLSQCMGSAVGFNIKGYAEELIDLYKRRRIIESAQSAIEEAMLPVVDVPTISISTALETQLQGLGKDTKQPFVSIDESLDSLICDYDNIKEHGILPGMQAQGMDFCYEMFSGFHRGEMMVVAGRPGMGKSAFAGSLARGFGENGHSVAFFSLEMDHKQLSARMISDTVFRRANQEIPFGGFRDGSIPSSMRTYIVKGRDHLSSLPIRYYCDGMVTTSQIRSQCALWKRELEASGQTLDIIIVDYIQLVSSLVKESRVQQVSEITRNLKLIAKELGVCVIALSQLSRAVENREDKRPMLSDLRESGTIEQDADAVIFLYREEYYIEKQLESGTPAEKDQAFYDLQAVKDKCSVILAKFRHSQTGSREVTTKMSTSSFYGGSRV